MDQLQKNDLNRMIMVIEHDSQMRIKEIKIKSIQRYNTLKDQIIKDRTKEIDEIYKRRKREINKSKEREVALIKNKYKMKMLEIKNRKIEEIKHNVKEELLRKRIDEILIEDCLRWISGDKTEYFAICSTRDFEIVKFLTEMEVKELPYDGIGGLIICSKDGRMFCDNSYKTRIDIFEEKYINLITNKLFK